MKKNSVPLLLFVLIISIISCRNKSVIDRYAMVTMYNIYNSDMGNLKSFSVGNGEFEFTVDITGMQTFPEFYSGVISPGTISERERNTLSHFPLAKVGLQILKKDVNEISIKDILNPFQKLDLWTGEIDSRFNIEDVPVHLKTVCHPDYDMISVKIISDLIGMKRLKVKIIFPSEDTLPGRSDFTSPDNSITNILSDTNNITLISRSRNKDKYYVLLWRNSARLKPITKQLYYLEPARPDSVYSFSCQFLNDTVNERMQNFGETEAASKKKWETFWKSIDESEFSQYAGSNDNEIQRKAILSLYLSGIKHRRSFR